MKRYSNSHSFYICSTRSKGWKHKRCHIHSFRIEQIDTFTWDCVASLLSQPELVEEQLTKEAGVNKLEQLQKRIRLLKTKVDHLQAKIRRVQDGYEAGSPVYTATEAIKRIANYRYMVASEEIEITRLRQSMEQQFIGKETAQTARQVLVFIRDSNLYRKEEHDQQTWY